MSPPVYTILAGPNGAGKSTLARSLESFGVTFGPMINPNNIALSMGNDNSNQDIQAARFALNETQRHIHDGRDFTRETTLSSKEIIGSIKLAKTAGFIVRIIFIGADDLTDTSQRVAERVALGGHDVPLTTQKRRFGRSHANAVKAALFTDEMLFFSNAASQFILHGRYSQSGFESLSMPLPNWLLTMKQRLEQTI
ncbi:MAG: zeta toxin family protein [bacterium]